MLSVLVLASVCLLPCHAAAKAYNWYCVHVKDHVQPSVGGDIAFVEELDGYYIDRNHTLQTDPDKVIYLTFDAGYENGNVDKILDILKEEQVPAAFFVLENLIRRNTELIKRMADEFNGVAVRRVCDDIEIWVPHPRPCVFSQKVDARISESMIIKIA